VYGMEGVQDASSSVQGIHRPAADALPRLGWLSHLDERSSGVRPHEQGHAEHIQTDISLDGTMLGLDALGRIMFSNRSVPALIHFNGPRHQKRPRWSTRGAISR
jgi:hypothetical protein